jgi:hypothetical protein
MYTGRERSFIRWMALPTGFPSCRVKERFGKFTGLGYGFLHKGYHTGHCFCRIYSFQYLVRWMRI